MEEEEARGSQNRMVRSHEPVISASTMEEFKRGWRGRSNHDALEERAKVMDEILSL